MVNKYKSLYIIGTIPEPKKDITDLNNKYYIDGIYIYNLFGIYIYIYLSLEGAL